MTDDDATAPQRALCWLHGFGRSSAVVGNEIDDLLEKVAEVPASAAAHGATTAAEKLIGWPSSVYWYLAGIARAFGALAIGEWNPPLIVGIPYPEASCCPFDTGGLLADPPHFECGVPDHAARCDYVERHVRPIDGWHGTAKGAISAAFDSFDDYVEAKPPPRPSTENPHSHFVAAATLDDGRPWWWELRVDKASVSALPEPSQIHWHDDADRLATLARVRTRLGTIAAADRPSLLNAATIITTRSRVSPAHDAHNDVREMIKGRAS